MPDSPRRLPVLGVQVTPMTMGQAVSIADQAVSNEEKRRFVFCTTHTLVESQDRPQLKEAVNRSDVVATDGMPLVWLSRLKGARGIERVYGPDAMLALCEYGVARGWRHYFYGATESTLSQLESKLCKRFPGLIVAGSYSPPFRPLSEEERHSIIKRINAAKPDMVWVGIGMPKQELWMAENQADIDAPLILAVGAAFDFHSGAVRQAPRWMQRSGTEWLFRLMKEPRRLWKRYLIGNARFIWLLGKETMTGFGRTMTPPC